MREFGRRTATAIVFGIVVLGAYYLGGVPWFVVLGLAAGIACIEFYSLARHSGYRPVVAVGVVMVLALVTQTLLGLDLAWAILSLGLLTTVAWGYRLQTSSSSFIADWASTLRLSTPGRCTYVTTTSWKLSTGGENSLASPRIHSTSTPRASASCRA